MMRLSGRIALCLALAGCASTKVETTGTAQRPLCRPELSALVAWTPAWRPDQKDVAAREAAAQRGIERFFAESGCFAKSEIRRGTADPRPAADRVVLITVRELGPVVRIGSPSLLEGGTEVVLDIRILGTPADFRVHWKNGGAFVIKGVGSLHQDMAAALEAAFAPRAETLGGTSWQLVKFQGGDDAVLRPDDKSKYTIAFTEDGNLNARIDCNRGRGTWKSSGKGQLELGPMAITRAACPPGSLHDRIVKQLPYIRSYVIKDGHLFLSLMADGGTYEFEGMP